METCNVAFFQDLYHTHQSDLVRFAERRVGRNIGEDLVEETFLYAWWKIAELRGHPVPKKWLYATLLNRCRHEIARKSFQSEIATDLTELPISTELECGLLEVLPKGLSEGELQGGRRPEAGLQGGGQNAGAPAEGPRGQKIIFRALSQNVPLEGYYNWRR